MVRLTMEEDTAASPSSTTTIPVVIVESHQHVLEHVHDILRRQERRWRRQRCKKNKKEVKTATDDDNGAKDPSSYSLLSSSRGWSMIHFDSHPDLATSKDIPARLLFTPRGHEGCDECSAELKSEGDISQQQTLYEMLDLTSTGIAEWILPLVLAANLRRIEWIKQSFSTQLPVGTHQYHVGVYRDRDGNSRVGAPANDNNIVTSFVDLRPNDRLKVDWYHPYYLDDDSYVSTNQLVLKQPLRLNVKELVPSTDPTAARASQIKNGENNNYDGKDNDDNLPSAGWLLDICLDYFVCCNPYLQELNEACPEATIALLDVMNKSSFGTSSNSSSNDVYLCSKSDCARGMTYAADISAFRSFLVQFLEKESELERDKDVVDNNIKDDIVRYFPGMSFGMVNALLDKLIQCIDGDTKILRMIIETIPNWNMPHSIGTDERLGEQMQLIEQEIELTRTKYNNRQPFMITIARSSLDGFTPPHVVEKLQSDVLSIIERIFCDSSNNTPHNCRLEIVKDHGEWEGSTIPDNIFYDD